MMESRGMPSKFVQATVALPALSLAQPLAPTASRQSEWLTDHDVELAVGRA